MLADIVRSRRAIEALRSGVPSAAAVKELGTTQHEIVQCFDAALTAGAGGGRIEPVIFDASLGVGKTHLLQYLAAMASERGFVTSHVTVSPEMPLGNGQVVLKAIAESARAPGREGRALRALASDLRTDSEAFAAVQVWARDSNIEDRFRAMLHLYEACWADEELRLRILDDIGGRPMLKSVISRELRALGLSAGYSLKGGPRNALLAHDRLRVFAQICRARTRRGIVVLFDEVERIVRFTFRQRSAAYAELGWWRHVAGSGGSYIVPVFAMTPGLYSNAVQDDRQRLGLLRISSDGQANRHSPLDTYDQMVLSGMDLLESARPLELPTEEDRSAIRYRVKALYERAYGLAVPDAPETRSQGSTTIRADIRRWITRWDLYRHDPSYIPDILSTDVVEDTSEIRDEELPPHDDDPDD